MPLETLALYAVAGILLVGATTASFFIVSEVITLARDIARNRERAADDFGDRTTLPERRITPFRDRNTVERLIAYFRGQGRK